jgi:Cu/Ag efflux pump CusA
MFERFVEWCARHRGLMVTFAIVITVAGVYSLQWSPSMRCPI